MMNQTIHKVASHLGKNLTLKQIANRELVLKYAFALFVVGVATYVRIVLQTLIEDRLPFATYTLAVILVAWIGGAGPAILSLILSSVSAAHYVIPPDDSLHIADPADQIALAVFVVVGTVSIALFGRVEYQRNRALKQAIENEQLNSQLRELDQRKDEFLSLLAHELRSPMAPIRNAIALTEKLPVDSPDHQALLQLISRNFNHLVRLVDDLLDVSRYLRGSIVLKWEVINLCDCLHSAVEMTSNYASEKRHQVIVDVPDEPIYVYADPVRCCQIVCNLLSNAIKYTPEQGRIHVSALVRQEAIELAVKDNGLGIAEDNRRKIFEPFFQANLKQTRYGTGLGLGLTIVQKLTEMHGGQVELYSRGVNAGSRFSVRFPKSLLRDGSSLADSAPNLNETGAIANKPDPAHPGINEWSDDSSPSTSLEQSAEKERVRVMICDDDVDTARTLSKLLALEGFDTKVTNDGLAAIKLCQTFLPDVLLLDIGLPEMDGFEVARALRAEKFGEHLKIVVISGWGAESDKRAGREAGFDVHLVKPVNIDELMPHLIPTHRALAVPNRPR